MSGEQVKMAFGTTPTATPAVLESDRPTPSAGHRVDWLELLVLGVFAAVSLWVVAVNLYYARTHGLVWTGVDGVFPGDQMQYLAWIRDASHHGLASDLFVPWPTPHDYLEPMVAISGGLAALGVAPWLALLLWKPLAVLAVFFAVRGLCRRLLASPWERRAALALALFAAWGPIRGDEWLPFISWGYPYALMSVGALVGALLLYDGARAAGGPWWPAPVLGLLASWLHPWEGQTLLLIVVGAEVLNLRQSLRRGLWRQLALPAVMLVATGLPFVYYAALDRFDSAWRDARVVGVTQYGHTSLAAVIVPLVPLLVASALVFVRRPRGFLATATLVWPLATLVASALNGTSAGGGSLHSWTGITIPLGVLAVIGLRNVRAGALPGYRLLAAAAVAALTIPVTVQMMQDASNRVRPQTKAQNFVSVPEKRALQYLAADPRPGMVLTDYAWGIQVAGMTGRRSYASGLVWAGPRRIYRADAAARVLLGPFYWWVPPAPTGQKSGWQFRWADMTGRTARAFVARTGARFVLENCDSRARERADLTRWLAPITLAVHRFGCATVYEVS